MSVQFGPRLPLARAKLSEAMVAAVRRAGDGHAGHVGGGHGAGPPETEQAWPVGLVSTVTL